MYTFFEENAEALVGKNLVPFSTHEGSGLSGFDKKLSSAIPGSTVLKGLATRSPEIEKSWNGKAVMKTVECTFLPSGACEGKTQWFFESGRLLCTRNIYHGYNDKRKRSRYTD